MSDERRASDDQPAVPVCVECGRVGNPFSCPDHPRATLMTPTMIRLYAKEDGQRTADGPNGGAHAAPGNRCTEGRHHPEPAGMGWCQDCGTDLAPLLRHESDEPIIAAAERGTAAAQRQPYERHVARSDGSKAVPCPDCEKF